MSAVPRRWSSRAATAFSFRWATREPSSKSWRFWRTAPFPEEWEKMPAPSLKGSFRKGRWWTATNGCFWISAGPARAPGRWWPGDGPSGPSRAHKHYIVKSDNTGSPAPLVIRRMPWRAAESAHGAKARNCERGNGNDDLRSGARAHHHQTPHLARYRRSRIHRLKSPGDPPQPGSAGGRAGQFFPGEARQPDAG